MASPFCALRATGSIHTLLASVALVALTTPLMAQGQGGGTALPLQGQWEGPYDLQDIMVELPACSPNPGQDHALGEIAHASLLPAGPNAGKIMFWNWPNAANPLYWPRSFVWDPDDAGGPINAAVLCIPSASNGSEDIFCAGHSFLANGDLFSAGGRDFMQASLVGTNEAFVFRQATGAWERFDAVSSQPHMGRDRYYPTTVKLGNGNVVVFGHSGLTTEDGATVGPPGTRITRDEYIAVSDQFGVLRENHDHPVFPADPNACEPFTPLEVPDYPKVFLTSENMLMWVDGEHREPAEELHVSWFLPLDEVACATSQETHRWREGVETTHDAFHAGGNAAHLLITQPGGDVTELVYNIGGTEHGFDDSSQCAQGVPITNMVERMVDPGPIVAWDDAGVPDLNMPRKNSNTVVLLDGSLLVIGGIGGPNCEAWLEPERHEPPEVFGADAVPGWTTVADHQHGRRYHSVAALLPDGRVVSAGGQMDPSRHSLEIYKPWYYFKRARPKINNPPATGSIGGSAFVDVTVAGGASIDRVAILSPTSATHAFNFDQRYVQLDFDVFAGPFGSPPEYTLQVFWPDLPEYAPPGYYLLTVVDDQDTPSPAAFVRLQ